MDHNKQLGVIETKVCDSVSSKDVSDQSERKRKQLQHELQQAIKRWDLKLIHSLILDGNLEVSSLEPQDLFRLVELSVISYDTSLIRELLKYDIDLNTVAGGKLLWHAMGANDLKIAAMLIFAGVNLEVRNYHDIDTQSTLLLVLTQSNNSKKLELAETIIDHGADINAVDCLGRSVLFHCLSNKKANSLLQKLLHKDVIVNDNVFEPLVIHPDTLHLLPILINRGCDNIETRNRRAKIAIRQLCQKSGNLSALKVVLDLVNLPFEEIDEEQNLLIYAIQWGRLQMIEFLLQCGADVNQVSKDGKFPLHEAVSHRRGYDISKLLIEKGANINSYSQYTGQYPIHVASKNSIYSNIQLLLRHGADVNVIDFECSTPYSLFVETWGPYEFRIKTHKEFIKRFSILITKKSTYLEDDLTFIRINEDFNQFLDACLQELTVMKSAQISDVSVFSILSMKLEKLSILTKNDTLVLDFYGSRLSFPIYAEDVNFTFKKAQDRKKRLLLKEEALYDALLPFLPDLVIEYIAVYLWWSDY